MDWLVRSSRRPDRRSPSTVILPLRLGNLFDLPSSPPWEQAAEADRLVAAVVINRPIDTVFHYLVPQELRDLIQPGQRVRVPFGRGDDAIVGTAAGPTAPTSTMKSLTEILDREPLRLRPCSN